MLSTITKTVQQLITETNQQQLLQQLNALLHQYFSSSVSHDIHTTTTPNTTKTSNLKKLFSLYRSLLLSSYQQQRQKQHSSSPPPYNKNNNKNRNDENGSVLESEQLSNLFLVMYHCHRIMTLCEATTMNRQNTITDDDRCIEGNDDENFDNDDLNNHHFLRFTFHYCFHFLFLSESKWKKCQQQWKLLFQSSLTLNGNNKNNNSHNNKQNQSHHFATRDKTSFVLLLIRLLFDNWCSSHNNGQQENNRNREKVVINTVMEELIACFQEYTYQSIDRSVVKYRTMMNENNNNSSVVVMSEALGPMFYREWYTDSCADSAVMASTVLQLVTKCSSGTSKTGERCAVVHHELIKVMIRLLWLSVQRYNEHVTVVQSRGRRREKGNQSSVSIDESHRSLNTIRLIINMIKRACETDDYEKGLSTSVSELVWQAAKSTLLAEMNDAKEKVTLLKLLCFILVRTLLDSTPSCRTLSFSPCCSVRNHKMSVFVASKSFETSINGMTSIRWMYRIPIESRPTWNINCCK